MRVRTALATAGAGAVSIWIATSAGATALPLDDIDASLKPAVEISSPIAESAPHWPARSGVVAGSPAAGLGPATAIPEPSALGLFAAGLVVIACSLRRPRVG